MTVQTATGDVLATDVQMLETIVDQSRGALLREVAPDQALVFPFEDGGRQIIHMLGVPQSLDVVWVLDGEITRVKTLRAWGDLAWGTADTVVEFPAGAADGLERGDEIQIQQ